MGLDFKKIDHILDRPDSQSEKGVILIPGISGGALNDEKYSQLSEILRENGFYCLRFSLWESEEELKDITIREITDTFGQAINTLKIEGCKSIGFLGNSFGAGLLLAYDDSSIKSRVLWAPAIGFDSKSNIKKCFECQIRQFKHYKEIKLNKKDLSDIKTPVLIIHGTKDKTVKKEEAENLHNNLPNGNIEFIENADHEFNTPEEISKAIQKSVDFFKKTL